MAKLRAFSFRGAGVVSELSISFSRGQRVFTWTACTRFFLTFLGSGVLDIMMSFHEAGDTLLFPLDPVASFLFPSLSVSFCIYLARVAGFWLFSSFIFCSLL
jgi:hypothetical protein